MDNKVYLFVVFLVLAIGMVVPMAFAVRANAACRDGSDNDGDGYTDWPADPGCTNKNDQSELNPNIECDDGADNDGDSDVDSDDSGCSGPTDDDETDCGDGVCEGGEVCDVCVADCGICDSCDETDSGWDIYVQGTAYGYKDGSPYNNTDYCVSGTVLMEYYCLGDQCESGSYPCDLNSTMTCVNGACAY